MKKLIFLIVLLFISFACSNNQQENNVVSNLNSDPAQNSSNANNAAMTNTNPGAMQPYNGIQNLNPNAFNASNDNLKVVNVAPQKSQTPFGQRMAPDDSVVTAGSRGKDFYEMRVFNSHPTLSKVEKITDGVTTKYKVYLKNGKVIEAPADQMSNFTAMAPQNILDLVGIKPKPQKQVTNNSANKEQEQ